jgi:phage terminase large subunit
MDVNASFPGKLRPLFKPARYKVLYGGRGGAKSWGVARALLIQGKAKRLRVLCTREVQKSLKDSVHQLLTDQIEAMGMGDFYQVLETEIRGANGTTFLFNGLSKQTKDTLKSYEGVDIVWCEEAHSITKPSWDLLIPTIRKEGSEIWLTFNPDLETDETYRRFVTNPPPNSVLITMSYRDNPWFPQVLEDERLHCKATESEEDYNNIWEGFPRSAAKGAIYSTEYAKAVQGGRVSFLPYDPRLKVHTVWDMGFGDNMAMIMTQVLRSEIRIFDYIQVRFKKTDECVAMLQQRHYNWGYDFLPHDGEHVERKTGMSDKDILTKMNRKVRITPNIPREDGIRAARNIMARCCFDNRNIIDEPTHKEGVYHLIECIKRYRRAETKHGGDGLPVHDEFSDGADAFRYLSLVANLMTNEDDNAAPILPMGKFVPFSTEMGY